MAYIELLPDWTPAERVVLALPSHKLVPDNREEIIRDYAMYLRGQDIDVTVLKNKTTSEGIIATLEQAGVELVDITAGDIWIRDWAPLLCKKDGKLLAVKFNYPKSAGYDAKKDNNAGTQLADQLQINLLTPKKNIVWEMGNYTSNGKDIIVTDQVLDANNLESAEELKARLIKMNFDPEIKIYVLRMNRLEGHLWELLGEKAKDAICHIDGYMRFTDENTVVYSLPELSKLKRTIAQSMGNEKKKTIQWCYAYLGIYTSMCDSILELVNILDSKGFKLVRIDKPIELPATGKEQNKGETLADEGDYINFLRYGKECFLLPQYGKGAQSELDTIAMLKYTHEAGVKATAVQEKFINVLSEAGGVLNCAAWVKYKI